MDKLKYVKLELNDGTYSDAIPLAVDSDYVDIVNENLTNYIEQNNIKLNKKPYYYNSIQEMKNDNSLKIGDMAIILGYYQANDGGAAKYKIVSGNYIDDGGSYHQLNNNLYAELIVENDTVNYKMFGAKGNGVIDDYKSIYNTHIYANKNNLDVFGLSNDVYYIGDISKTVPIKTNVDFKKAKFIIDDTQVTTNRTIPIFTVVNSEYSINCTNLVSSINEGQTKISELAGKGFGLVEAINSNKKDFIRIGGNTDNGTNRTDYFRIDNEGKVIDKIIRQFDNITSLKIFHIDTEELLIQNGIFETKVNKVDSYNYYSRNIEIQRSNTRIKNIYHTIIGEDETEVSSPYVGFIHLSRVTNCFIENCCLQSHKTYLDENDVSKGSYDIGFLASIDIYVTNLKQLNDISDDNCWGIHTSNYCKKLHFNNCYLNRIDAHKGMYDLYVDNCILGRQAFSLIGGGIANITNTTVINHYCFIYLRTDYGATWDGDINITNCKLVYNKVDTMTKAIIRVENNQNHNFGYKCYFPNLFVKNFNFISDNSSNETFVACFIKSDGNVDFLSDYDTNVSNDIYPYLFKDNYSFDNITVNSPGEISAIFRNRCIKFFYTEKIGKAIIENTDVDYYNYNNFETNMNIIIKNITFKNKLADNYLAYSNSIFSDYNVQSEDYTATHRVIPKVLIDNCNYLWLGFSGIASELHIKNSDIYQTRAGYNGSYVLWYLDNCRIHYHYLNNNPSDEPCCLGDINAMFFTNCEFLNDDEVNLSDIINVETPFRFVNTGSQRKTTLFGFYINNKFWENCLNDFKSTTKYERMVKCNCDLTSLVTNVEKNVKYPTHGAANLTPENYSNHPIPIHFIYYDETNSKLIRWNGTKWIDI